ncbi:peptide ABC transporter substrate-binding protein [Patiriisocius marinistellae]|uniref:Peptide ABC transporter substrate-binding protein n=1 Tax=Patiriisocius marinistellae TaxID=2494560 RepID=A0A5J4G1Q4_9FLAO|nr:ABC transporter substrate-binding protein [Patiriisocius marinistellae]GEQ85961.1 peptide ABC transporter substrate-binding protein [Patiriisocius marinistellae]
MTHPLKKTLHTISILCLIILFFGCSNHNNNKNDHQVFRYNEHSNIASLDPAFARTPQTIWPTNQLFNGLVQLDDSLNIKPDVAKSWIINDSTSTYTFTLRSDVYFHKNDVFGNINTRKVVASDFTYSFDRLTSPALASPGSWVLKAVKSYHAENDSTFIIQLKKPFPAFLGLLSMRYCSVVPKEAIEFYGNDFRSNPVGTGPFQFKMWEENVKLVLRKNSNYFEKDENGENLPYLEAIAITFLPDKQSEFLQFAQGKIDFMSGLDNSYKDEIITTTGKLQPKYKTTTNLISAPYLNTEYLGFFMGTNSTEVQSPLLRQAINYGFDREKMVTYLRNGMGIPAINGFIPKGLPGFDAIKGYNYNPEKARELIEQYKLESGNANPRVTIGTNSQYLDVCEYIQRELEKLGVEIDINVMPPSTLRQMKSSGKLDIFRASWVADYPDAENYLSLFYSPNFTPNGPNYTHYKNTTFDSLYVKAQQISEINDRKILYTKMDSIVIADAPIVPLYYDMAVRFVSKKISGLGINPQNFLVLKRVKKEK